jgi:hypothetical protein
MRTRPSDKSHGGKRWRESPLDPATDPLAQLVKLLAEMAVEEFLAECRRGSEHEEQT